MRARRRIDKWRGGARRTRRGRPAGARRPDGWQLTGAESGGAHSALAVSICRPVRLSGAAVCHCPELLSATVRSCRRRLSVASFSPRASLSSLAAVSAACRCGRSWCEARRAVTGDAAVGVKQAGLREVSRVRKVLVSMPWFCTNQAGTKTLMCHFMSSLQFPSSQFTSAYAGCNNTTPLYTSA